MSHFCFVSVGKKTIYQPQVHNLVSNSTKRWWPNGLGRGLSTWRFRVRILPTSANFISRKPSDGWGTLPKNWCTLVFHFIERLIKVLNDFWSHFQNMITGDQDIEKYKITVVSILILSRNQYPAFRHAFEYFSFNCLIALTFLSNYVKRNFHIFWTLIICNLYGSCHNTRFWVVKFCGFHLPDGKLLIWKRHSLVLLFGTFQA